MKCNLKFKNIKKKRNVSRWQINKLNEEKLNEKFKEYTNNVKISEEQDIDTRWTSLKKTITRAAIIIMKQ